MKTRTLTVSAVPLTALLLAATCSLEAAQLAGSVLAGGTQGGYADGRGAAARFARITGIDTDAAGRVYVADAGNARIRLVYPDGTVRTLAGTGETITRDGTAATAAFGDLRRLGVDARGTCYVDDGNTLRRVDVSGAVTTLCSLAIPTGDQGSTWTDGYYEHAHTVDAFHTITSLVVSPSGSVWACGVAHAADLTIWPGIGGPKSDGTERTTNVVFAYVGTAWEPRLATTEVHSWAYYGGEFWGGEAILTVGKGRTNEIVLYVGDGVFALWNRHLDVLGAGGRWTFATVVPDPWPIDIAAVAWVSENEMLLHDRTGFSSATRGAQLVPVSSTGTPGLGLARGQYGLLYSATETAVLQFVPAGTVALSLAASEPPASTARLVILAQPGDDIRVEQRSDLQSWSEMARLVRTGRDEQEVPVSGALQFFRARFGP